MYNVLGVLGEFPHVTFWASSKSEDRNSSIGSPTNNILAKTVPLPPLDLTRSTVIYCVCAPVESLWVELVSRVRTVAFSRTFRLRGYSVVEISFRTEISFRVFKNLFSELTFNFRHLNFRLSQNEFSPHSNFGVFNFRLLQKPILGST